MPEANSQSTVNVIARLAEAVTAKDPDPALIADLKAWLLPLAGPNERKLVVWYLPRSGARPDALVIDIDRVFAVDTVAIHHAHSILNLPDRLPAPERGPAPTFVAVGDGEVALIDEETS